jgi:hypothetical protein
MRLVVSRPCNKTNQAGPHFDSCSMRMSTPLHTPATKTCYFTLASKDCSPKTPGRFAQGDGAPQDATGELTLRVGMSIDS